LKSILPNTANKALSTLATIVAEFGDSQFGDSRRFRRQTGLSYACRWTTLCMQRKLSIRCIESDDSPRPIIIIA